jgi:hypothetical protein
MLLDKLHVSIFFLLMLVHTHRGFPIIQLLLNVYTFIVFGRFSADLSSNLAIFINQVLNNIRLDFLHTLPYDKPS